MLPKESPTKFLKRTTTEVAVRVATGLTQVMAQLSLSRESLEGTLQREMVVFQAEPFVQRTLDYLSASAGGKLWRSIDDIKRDLDFQAVITANWSGRFDIVELPAKSPWPTQLLEVKKRSYHPTIPVTGMRWCWSVRAYVVSGENGSLPLVRFYFQRTPQPVR